MRRRHAQAWERLLAQFQPNWFVGGPGDQLGRNQIEIAPPQEAWRNIQGAHDLWTMYENAQLMLNMANYAGRNSDSVDKVLLASLHNDSMQIRTCVMLALSLQSGSQAGESTSVNMAHATTAYNAMVARMAELMGTNGRTREVELAETA